MNEFMIRFAGAESALSKMQQLESAIRSDGEEISKIRNGFRSEYGAKTRILQDLGRQIDKMADLGDSMKTFETSLESILGLYTAVEQDLLGRLEEQIKSAATVTYPSYPAEETAPIDIVADRIHQAGKADEKGGLIPGATIIGASTLGTSVSDESGTGLGQKPAASNLLDIGSRLEQMPTLVYKELPEDATWEEYLELLDPDVVAALPESALDYLHELYDVLKEFPMPFGALYFPGVENICDAGIWTPFYTLISWYYYHRDLFPGKEGGFGDFGSETGESGNEPGNSESGSGDSGSETGDVESGTGDSEKQAVDTENGSGDPEKQSAAPGNDETSGTGTENAGKSAGESNQNKESGSGTSGDTSGSSQKTERGIIGSGPDLDSSQKVSGEAGVKGIGKAGTVSSAQSTADQAAGKSTGGSGSGGGSGSHGSGSGSGSGGGSSYPGEPAVDVPATDDAAKDYLSGLTGESGTGADGASDWAHGAMDDWGQKAGEALAGSGGADASAGTAAATAGGGGAGVFGRTARSVVYAAVINAGLEMVMHGAGAIGSILGDGKEDPFPDMNSGELL